MIAVFITEMVILFKHVIIIIIIIIIKSFYILNIHVDFPWKEGVLITTEHQYYPVLINFISKYLGIALIEFVQTQQQQPLLSLFA